MTTKTLNFKSQVHRGARAFLLFSISLMASHTGKAAIATFQNGGPAPFGGGTYTNVQDTHILLDAGSGNGEHNYGGEAIIDVGELPASGASPRHTLIRFDVTSLEGKYLAITNVTLRLAVTFPNNLGNGDWYQVFRLNPANADWVEGTGKCCGGPPSYGMSTWNHKIEDTVLWAGSPGGSTSGVDYFPDILAQSWRDLTNTEVGTYVDFIFSDISFFNEWIAGNNPGLLLRTATQLDSRLIFASSQAGVATQRPQIDRQLRANAPRNEHFIHSLFPSRDMLAFDFEYVLPNAVSLRADYKHLDGPRYTRSGQRLDQLHLRWNTSRPAAKILSVRHRTLTEHDNEDSMA